MSKLLEEAFTRLAELPEADQDPIAKWLLQEMESERRWQKLFFESHDVLSGLADVALAEHRRGRTKELDPESL